VFSDKEPMVRIKQFGDFKLKDHEERVIPMSKLVFESLFPHRKESGFLFESNHESEGKWRYRFDPRKSLVTALKKAGLTTSDPFQRLRHTFGSLHAQKGVSIFKVSKWLGHSSVQVTERHYAGLQAYDSDIDSF
jgi:integrase